MPDGAIPDTYVPDSNVPDTYVPDTSVADAGPPPVSVTVTDWPNKPVAGVAVYFYEPGGTVVKVITDSTGKASHQMLGGGSITAARFAGGWDIETVIDVQSGDTIAFNQTSDPNPSPAGTLTGNVTGAPAADAGTLTYSMDFGGCSASGGFQGATAYAYTYYAACVVLTGKLTFVVVAKDASGNVVAYAPHTVDTVGTDAGTVNVDTAASDWVLVQPKAVAITGSYPPGSWSLSVDVDFPTAGRLFGDTSVNTPFGALPTSFPYSPLPVAFAPSVQLGAQMSGISPTEVYAIGHFTRAPNATALSEDLGSASFPPRVHFVSVLGTKTAPSISWQQDAPLAISGTGTVTLNGTATTDGGPSTALSWTITFPVAPTTTSVTFPALPADLVALATPDQPWTYLLLQEYVSPQVPYSLAHLYPSFLGNFGSTMFLPQVTSFDVGSTLVRPYFNSNF